MHFNHHFEPVYTGAQFYDLALARGKARHFSREIDFGVMWRDQDFPGCRFRLTWIVDTGEFVSVLNDETTVLGIMLGEERAENTLDGWAQACILDNSLAWARERLVSGGAAACWIPEGFRRVSSGFALSIEAEFHNLLVTYDDIGGETCHGEFSMHLNLIPDLITEGRALLREIAAHAPARHQVADAYTITANLAGTSIWLAPRHGQLACRAEPWEFDALLCGLSAWLDEVYESLGEDGH
jgi:hypothetical protein